MNTLLISHVPGMDPPRFRVVRGKDHKQAEPAAVESPIGFPVEGRPDSDLMRELRWYLEQFLTYPYPPQTDIAERVRSARRRWGRQAFTALFNAGQARTWYDAAVAGGLDQLHLQVSSDDPRILAWPWEALEDPQGDVLARACRIERRLNQIYDAPPVSKDLPTDRVNILLVTARPFEGDVRYRSISRPLVELIERQNLPAEVTVLRPPTFAQLRRHLHERPHFYHILHFDGHGGYGIDPEQIAAGEHRHTLLSPTGQLLFEDDKGNRDAVQAEQLASLLREFQIPAVVLNACQSGMIDERAEGPFASVATALLKAGIRSVVAMAYAIRVSGAQEFLPAFYARLFESGDVAEAVLAGRQKMFEQPGRVCARGRFDLDDWLVPVTYQQDPLPFSFAAKAKPRSKRAESRLPDEASDRENPYGFIGRDGPLLALERAMHLDAPGILIHGLGGVGKTTLARGFVQWLDATNGLGEGCFWFTFDDIRTAEFVINRMGEALLGPNFATAKIAERIEALAQVFNEHRFVIVWDNFEVAHGIAGTPVDANLSAEERGHLHTLLKRLRGGRTKVIITSRSAEEWLGVELVRISITGLEDEERWEYCDKILGNLNVKIDRTDPDLVRLMDLLDGHPLAMRAILPKLEKLTAAHVAAALQSNLADLSAGGDKTQAKLFATLRFVEKSLPEDLRPLLVPLAMHERYLDANFLERMAKQVDSQWTRARIDGFLGPLAGAGLVRDCGQAIYELHPALTGFLRSTVLRSTPDETRDAWPRAFVDVMGRVADQLAPRPLHEQRFAFHVHAADLHYALGEAERLKMETGFAAIAQSMAVYAKRTRNFKGAADLFRRFAAARSAGGDKVGEATAYHQLGMIAHEQRELAAAKEWYQKSLAITGKLSDEQYAANTYGQLGTIAGEQRDFVAAEKWYRKALQAFDKLGIEQKRAITLHCLGIIAHCQGDFATAEEWYQKSLAITEELGDEYDAAGTYYQLGILAQKQGNFAPAETWYRKGLAVFERLGIEHDATIAYHQLGIIAAEQRDFAASERWYHKSLAIAEKRGDEYHAAGTYHQLGMIAQERRDFTAAENWYQKSLAINEKLGEDHSAASTCAQLGRLAAVQGRFGESGRWLVKAIHTFARCNDPHNAQQSVGDFLLMYKRASAGERPKLKAMWQEAGLGPWPGEKEDEEV